MSDRKAAACVMPVFEYLLSNDAQYLSAQTVTEIVAAARVLYVALGGHVRQPAEARP